MHILLGLGRVAIVGGRAGGSWGERGAGDGLVGSGGALGYRAGENIDPNDEGATTEQTKGTDAIAPVPISRGRPYPVAYRLHGGSITGDAWVKNQKKKKTVKCEAGIRVATIAFDRNHFRRQTSTMQVADLYMKWDCFSKEIGYVNGYVKHLAQSKA
jgi:hypothetical protein